MTATAWAAEREERSRFAIEASKEPGASVFRSWRFAETPLAQVALTHLRASRPPVGLTRWALVVPSASGADQTRRNHERTLRPAEADPALARAAQIAMLDWAGREVEDRERRAWQRGWTADPDADARATALWQGLAGGSPWEVRTLAELLWLKPATRAFAAVLASRDLPRSVQRRVLDDLREGFFYRLLGDGEGPPGWAEIAVRVLETVAPVEGPAATLSEKGREQAGRCITHRTGWGRTVAEIWADRPDSGSRALAAAATLADHSTTEALLDLHTVLRLIDASPETPAEAWRIVSQNRGKARGRLRALVANESGWLPVLTALDAIDARSRAAVARFAWAWAWQELAHDFPFDPSRAVTPRCDPIDQVFLPLSSAERAPLATWVLLVTLKGRHDHLQRWVATGGTGDRDSTWARLLKDLPVGLSNAEAYPRVRHALSETLDEHLDGWTPVLRRIAEAKVDRKLKRLLTTLLEPHWHADVPFPRSGFPTFVAHARELVRRQENVPWT